jgi:dihydrofolate synthase/folylpolyglutamate synthase
LGNPERHFDTVHIGGSNGKGSVAAMVAACLARAGLKVALYTSPHLVSVRERMLVNGRPISEAAFAQWTDALQPQIEDSSASFFEATTAIALADFAARGTDIAVVEVGLGGRLDSTNVLDPLVSAVTCVSVEHTDYLGESLEEIAREKAGIAKPERPFVIGETDEGVVAVLKRQADAVAAEVVVVPREAMYSGAVGMSGVHQRRNAMVASAVLDVLPTYMRPARQEKASGIAVAKLPGRFDRRGKWLFDVAHNPAAIATLAAGITQDGIARPLHGLVGLLRDKDHAAILSLLLPKLDSLWLTTPPSAPEEPDFARALDGVQRGAATVLVTGSFHTVGDAMSRLPGFPPLG